MRRRQLLLSGPAFLAAPAAGAQGRIDNATSPIFQHVKDGEADEVRNLLIAGESANVTGLFRVPLIIAAAVSGHIDVLKVVLDYRPIVDSVDMNGNTALIAAAEHGVSHAVEMLLIHRARIDAQNRLGTTALMEAARGGHDDVVKVLLKHKANVAITDYTGRTALAHARDNRQSSVESLLRAAGAR